MVWSYVWVKELTPPPSIFMDVKHVIAQNKKLFIQAIMVTKCNLNQFILSPFCVT